ncbi:MAG: SsrA-binding protein SmpB [Candidatus Kerfeldbacteria bacterium]|nr:SsrA-binding protein SmpB [Candidatus Kerfeldbacteria bacterium]
MPTLARNREAPYRYDLQEKVEAGIVLAGPEVKSIRAGRASLKGSFVQFNGDTPNLVNCHIAPYPMAAENPDPDRERRLLLRAAELVRLRQASKAAGLTIIPVRLYTKGGFIKVELALARGKRKVDRRERIKQRDVQRRIDRAVRSRIKRY